ncbi:MAG TPA: DUF4351 domain-containing protein [Povalibacter sp.]|uniref:DUF4351 domain-containing protein n=1 Tax=Povalibacter sp. TaxID=1962978 RepID=UPI002BD37F88|nr:DUF4351 domain-containing protein [Povalibacter sp.]HMN46789.1 DUF4351 domain-containing protein [Povalibacter sp.]
MSFDELTDLQEIDNMLSERVKDWTKNWKEQGIAEGRAEGRVDLITRLLSKRFGPLTDDVRNRISGASIDELDAIGERLLTAQTLQEAMESN